MLDPKVHLSITLTEPVVFLRSSDPSGRHPPDPNDPFTLVRGILNFNVAKPVSISSIEVELTGVLTVICPEGIGAGRVEIPEKHNVFSSTVTVYRAGQAPRYGKRPASVGPGSGLSLSGMHYSTNDEHSAIALTSSPPSSQWGSARRATTSVPSELGPTPPYTPIAQCPALIQSRLCTNGENPAQTLEELRQALRDNLEVHRSEFASSSHRRHSLPFSGSNVATHSNVCCSYVLDRENDSRTDDSAPSSPPFDITSFHSSLDDTPHSPNHPSRPDSPESAHGIHPPTRDNARDIPTGRSRLRLSLGSMLGAVMEVTSRASSMARLGANGGTEERERGRSRTRNLAEQPGMLETGDHVSCTEHHSGENASQHHMGHREYHLLGLGRILGLERDRDKHKDGGQPSKVHGNSTEFKPGTYSYPISFLLPPDLAPTFSLPHGSLSYTIKGIVHRPGTFTSKLSCQVPLLIVAAPVIGVGEGGDPGPILVQKEWGTKLAYSVGLSSRLFLIGSRRPLATVSNDVRGSTESLVQAQVEARSEPRYGAVTLDLTLLPLEKVKIWKLSVAVHQRVRHVDERGQLYRDDDVMHIGLLELQDACPTEEMGVVEEEGQMRKNKHKSKQGLTPIPLLPTPLSPDRSPLLRCVPPSTDPSVLVGPGPYALSTTIGLPECNGASGGLHFTVKQKRSDVKVEHTLRLTLRVESDTNQEEGEKKKLFDIAVQTPIAILSCRCAPEYQTLPRYSQITQDNGQDDDLACPCDPPDPVHRDNEHHLHGHHQVSMTPSSTSSFGSDDSANGGAPGPSTTPHQHPYPTPDVEYAPQPHPTRSSSRPRDHALPAATARDGPPGPGSRSSSVHASDRVSASDPHRSHSHHGPCHSGSRSRTQTPVSTPHPSRPPSPVLARRYERLVSGMESDAGEAPPSYYESIASDNF